LATKHPRFGFLRAHSSSQAASSPTRMTRNHSLFSIPSRGAVASGKAAAGRPDDQRKYLSQRMLRQTTHTGKMLAYRLNATHGPLKDGLDSSLFMRPERPFTQTETADIHRVEVHGENGPAHVACCRAPAAAACHR
jgi:hypothetical protein